MYTVIWTNKLKIIYKFWNLCLKFVGNKLQGLKLICVIFVNVTINMKRTRTICNIFVRP